MSYDDDPELSSRLARLEAKVNFLLARMGINPDDFDVQLRQGAILDPMLRGELLTLLRRNDKIQAIKLYRQRTGVGLKEAKDAMDALERQM